MLAIWLGYSLAVLGHNPDTSYVRVKVSADKVETRLSYDVFTLLRIELLDDNNDGEISRKEFARHAPQIQKYLQDHVRLTIDRGESNLGEPTGYVWPTTTGDAIREADYHSGLDLIQFT